MYDMLTLRDLCHILSYVIIEQKGLLCQMECTLTGESLGSYSIILKTCNLNMVTFAGED